VATSLFVGKRVVTNSGPTRVVIFTTVSLVGVEVGNGTVEGGTV